MRQIPSASPKTLKFQFAWLWTSFFRFQSHGFNNEKKSMGRNCRCIKSISVWKLDFTHYCDTSFGLSNHSNLLYMYWLALLITLTAFPQTSTLTTTVPRVRKGPTLPTLLLFPHRLMQSRETSQNRSSHTLPSATGRSRRVMSHSRWSRKSALGRTPSSISSSCLALSGSALCSTTSTRRKCPPFFCRILFIFFLFLLI